MRTLEIPGFGQGGASQCSVAFSPDSRLLSGACYQKKLPIWEVQSGRLLLSLESSAPVVAVAFSPDGRTLAAGGLSDMIDVYDTGTGARIRTFGPVQSPTWELAFSPTGDRLASAHKGPGSSSGGPDSTNMNLWDVSTGDLLWGSKAGGSGSLALSVDYAPDGETVAYGDLDDALIVDARTGRLLRTLPVGDHVGDLAFRFDGTLLVTGSDDDKVRLWRTADDGLQAVLEGHSGYVNGVSFSRDGSLLVSGSHDRRVGVWDVGKGQRLAWLDGHQNAVLRVAVDPADALIASIGWDGTIRLWGVPR